ncbi:hypothetical protein BKA65DRAFT_593657 [Rhexocercosporidium sp. MPI-PUGE-AT-0058]|nr:hypothetical protein BKA65DRAFT_593657 [Rhexocercosporidium sp. MPI-PUGE-AT-0058]
MPKQLSNDQPASKRRGRPLKDPSDPSTDLQRARVRRAQKAFRIRKEQHVAQLEERCNTLESVVEEMTNTFIEFSDGIVGGSDVDVHVKRALRGTMERFLELGRRAAREPGEEERDGDEEGNGEDQQDRCQRSDEIPDVDVGDMSKTFGSDLEPFAPSGSRDQEPTIFDTSSCTSSHLASSLTLPSQQHITTLSHPSTLHFFPNQRNANPYLNNIWTLPPPSPSDTSAIPYILAGRDSFAARLYFSILSSTVHSLRGSQPPTLASSFFRYKARYVAPLRIQSVVDGVLNMLLHGTSQARSADGGTLLGMGPGPGECNGDEYQMMVKRAIVREVEEGGEREEEFLATWGVERYLRSKWRLVLDSRTVRVGARAVGNGSDEDLGFGDGSGMGSFLGSERVQESVVMGAPTMIPGFAHSSQVIWDAGRLVERLLDVAVSIGEGPRWHYKKIDTVVEAFLVENRVTD